MSAKEILVPDIGDFVAVDVIEIHVRVGDSIQADDPMITLENDKASMDLPAPESGIVRGVNIKLGDKVSQGDLILFLEPSEAAATAASPAQKTEAAPPARSEAPAAVPAPSVPPATPTASNPSRSSRAHASPSIRKLAREKGVELSKVTGTGRKGRITREDVEEYIKQQKAAKEKAKKSSGSTTIGLPAIPAVDFSKFGPIEETKVGRIKRLTSAAMTRSWLNIPHVTHNDEADVTELEAFRKSIKPDAEKQGLRVSILSFAMKAVVETLKAFPTFNASLDPSGEHLILKQYYNIGIAVDTPNGLVVPVIKDVDKKSIFELSADLVEISQKARKNKLAISDIQGATFTISSLGGIGGTTFTPIINAPEVAILGMTRSQMKPIWNGKEFAPRLMQPLSLSYDHRVIDGAEAARFCRHLGTLLTDIRRILL